MTRLTWANAVSALRLLIIMPCAWAVAMGHWRAAAIWFVLAVATDISDGIIARRRNEVTAFGGLLDHVSDAAFVTVMLSMLMTWQLVPVALPPLIIAAFAQYTWDSRALSGAPLRASSLGRWNGIAYYVLVGTILISHALALSWPSHALLLAGGWVLVVSTLVSMVDRASTLWRLSRKL